MARGGPAQDEQDVVEALGQDVGEAEDEETPCRLAGGRGGGGPGQRGRVAVGAGHEHLFDRPASGSPPPGEPDQREQARGAESHLTRPGRNAAREACDEAEGGRRRARRDGLASIGKRHLPDLRPEALRRVRAAPIGARYCDACSTAVLVIAAASAAPVWSFQSYAWAARFALHFGSRSRPAPGLRSPEVLDEHQLGLGEGDLAEEDPTVVGRDPEREMGEGAFPAEDLNQSDGKSVEYLKGLEVRIATR